MPEMAIAQTISFDLMMMLRLVVAALLGGLIGIERGGTNHDAGLRTHIILCVGAASIMVLSECMVQKLGIPNESLRMGAQVVSGVGFLGAGSIILDGNRIRGMTTAAGLWTTACVGLVVGAGYYLIATMITLLMLVVMLGLRSMTKKLQSVSAQHTIKIELSSRDAVQPLLETLLKQDVEVGAIKIDEHKGTIHAILEIKLPRNLTITGIICDISALADVVGAETVS